MSVLVAFSVAPSGSESVSGAVAEVVRVVRASGLPNETNAMFTNVEGEWDEVMAVVQQAHVVQLLRRHPPELPRGRTGGDESPLPVAVDQHDERARTTGWLHARLDPPVPPLLQQPVS